jgi:Tfp pilus assembly protein PilO
MKNTPEKYNHWITLVITIAAVFGLGFKISYDVEANTKRSEENSATVDIIDRDNAVIKNELKHLRDEQKKMSDKIDKILEKLP